jgi:hypothetical protein
MANATDAVKVKQGDFIPAKKLKEYYITFHSGLGGDNSDVHITHNHITNTYKRNMQARINENYLSVLKDAVIDTTHRNEEGKEVKIRIQPYTYSVEEIPTEG